MQNKANFQKVKFNVNKVLTRDYDQMDTWSIRKTKPIQSQSKPIQSQLKPIKANSKPIQRQLKPIKCQNKPKQTQFQAGTARRFCKNPADLLSQAIRNREAEYE